MTLPRLGRAVRDPTAMLRSATLSFLARAFLRDLLADQRRAPGAATILSAQQQEAK